MRAVVYRGIDRPCGSKRFLFLKLALGELLVKVAVCGACLTDIKKSITALRKNTAAHLWARNRWNDC